MGLIALALLAIGIILVLAGKLTRRRHGLTEWRTLSLDNRTLFSRGLMLGGRTDRIVEEDGMPIPEEHKSSLRVFDSHQLQVGAYLILLEEETGIQPPYGVVVTGDGKAHRVPNTPELRQEVLAIAEAIRAMRRQLNVPIRVSQPPRKCAACGMREGCGQRSDLAAR